MLILKFPPISPHRTAEWKGAAISKQTFIWTPLSRSYNILPLRRDHQFPGQPFKDSLYSPGNMSKTPSEFSKIGPLTEFWFSYKQDLNP